MTLSSKLLALGETMPERPSILEWCDANKDRIVKAEWSPVNYALALESLAERLADRVEAAEKRPRIVYRNINEVGLQ